MMDKYFKVSICFFSLKATFSSFKKKERCDFITMHLTNFAMLYHWFQSCKANSK